MKNSNTNANLKEKLKQALTSTVRVISNDLSINNKSKENESSKEFNFFELDNLNSKIDFIRARAESDCIALKKNFLMKKFTKKIYLIIHHVNHSTQLLKR